MYDVLFFPPDVGEAEIEAIVAASRSGSVASARRDLAAAFGREAAEHFGLHCLGGSHQQRRGCALVGSFVPLEDPLNEEPYAALTASTLRLPHGASAMQPSQARHVDSNWIERTCGDLECRL